MSEAQLAKVDRLCDEEHGRCDADAAFLSRLSKAGIAEVLTEAGCAAEAVRGIEEGAKAETVVEAEKLLAGKGWLPSNLKKHNEKR